MKKIKLIPPLVLAAILSIGINRPAHAITGTLKNFFESTLDSTVGIFTNELQGQLQPHIEKYVSDTLGALGIPDLDEARENIEADVEAEKGSISRNPEVEKGIRSQDLENSVNDSIVESTLGADAQEASKKDTEAVSSNLDSISKSSTTALKTPITQRKMDAFIQNQARTAGLIARQGESIKAGNRISAGTLRAVNQANKRNSRIDKAEQEGGIGESQKFLLDDAASSGMWEALGK